MQPAVIVPIKYHILLSSVYSNDISRRLHSFIMGDHIAILL